MWSWGSWKLGRRSRKKSLLCQSKFEVSWRSKRKCWSKSLRIKKKRLKLSRINSIRPKRCDTGVSWLRRLPSRARWLFRRQLWRLLPSSQSIFPRPGPVPCFHRCLGLDSNSACSFREHWWIICWWCPCWRPSWWRRDCSFWRPSQSWRRGGTSTWWGPESWRKAWKNPYYSTIVFIVTSLLCVLSLFVYVGKQFLFLPSPLFLGVCKQFAFHRLFTYCSLFLPFIYIPI